MSALLLAVSLTYAHDYTIVYATRLGVKNIHRITVVATATDLDINGRPCFAWVTHSRIGWIVGFTPSGLDRPEEDVRRSAAHEACHIHLHGESMAAGTAKAKDEDIREEEAISCAERLTKRKAGTSFPEGGNKQ